MNNSPWIAQLRRTRPVEPLEENIETDVVVVGGGIAGVTTAYFLLTKTNKNVVLLEVGKIAHGATGHNAGQISSYFEKSLQELSDQFGFRRAVMAQKSIEEDARMLLEKVFITASLQTPRSEFIGYNGLTTYDQVCTALHDISLRAKSGILRVRPLLVAREWVDTVTIPKEYIPFINVVHQKNILDVLETETSEYIAALPFFSGCTNSALFSEELAGFLLLQYKDRFLLKEHTPVSRVILNQDDVTIETSINTVSAKEVVLCTNGFESIEIINNAGKNIDRFFHEEVHGKVGYMIAYKEHLSQPPFASIYSHSDSSENNPYFYVTRRQYEDETNVRHNLTCIGGPEYFLPDRATYDAKKDFPLETSDILETFALQTYKKENLSSEYKWHGLMGYTKSGVRLIGREPKNNHLLYNLGCNGVGILTSVYGAERIARIINGEVVEPTIFDPQ